MPQGRLCMAGASVPSCAADALRTGNVDEAMTKFLRVFEQEQAIGSEVIYGFKALRLVVSSQISRGLLDAAGENYAKLLALLPKVTANDANEAVDTVLDAISSQSTSADGAGGVIGKVRRDEARGWVGSRAVMVSQMYEMTLAATKERNERLWFMTLSKLASLYLESRNVDALRSAVERLHAACRTPEGQDDESKATQLMEVYALRIQVRCVSGRGALTRRRCVAARGSQQGLFGGG
jgi:hypothetical protein